MEAWKPDGISVSVVHLHNCSNFGGLEAFLGNSAYHNYYSGVRFDGYRGSVSPTVGTEHTSI